MSVAKKDYKRITTKTLIEMKENGVEYLLNNIQLRS